MTFLSDKKLSWKAIGILFYLFHNLKKNEKIKVDDLMQIGINGRSSVENGVKELEKANLLKRTHTKKANGRYADAVWTLNFGTQAFEAQ